VTSPMEVFFLRRAGCFNGNNVRKRPKIGHFSGPIETFQCIKTSHAVQIKYLQYGGRPSMTSLLVLYMNFC
jgi:hypothetical protein